MIGQYETYVLILSQENDDVKLLRDLALDASFKYGRFKVKYSKFKYIFHSKRINQIIDKLKNRVMRRYYALDMVVKLLWDEDVYRTC